MKDLIVIGAYCPDDERKELLEKCVKSLDGVKKDFDIMISSHSVIPEHIIKNVDYCFYFKDNELITDWEYLNRPWFSPTDGMTIESSFVTNQSTYLAAYSIFISALGIAKTLNYNTVHWIEYDSEIKDYSDLYENNVLIKEYVAVNYKKQFRNFENNLEWGYGCFQSINLLKLNEKMLRYDKSFYMKLLKESLNKTNEKITQDLYLSDGHRIFYKDFDNLISKGNKFNLSQNTEKDYLDYWTVPFWDTKDEKAKFIAWNNKDRGNINVSVIINDDKHLYFKEITKFEWRIKEIGDLEKIETITILINGLVKRRITLNTDLRNKFKLSSYSVHK